VKWPDVGGTIPLQPSTTFSVKNTTGILSKLPLMVILPLVIVLVIVLAIVSDQCGISFLEE
jgi:hypothetical protein